MMQLQDVGGCLGFSRESSVAVVVSTKVVNSGVFPHDTLPPTVTVVDLTLGVKHG